MRGLLGGRPVEPYLLVLGSIEPRKNAALVLQWAAEHPAILDEVRIVFAGRQAWGQSFTSQAAERGLQGALAAGRIVFTSFVDEAFRTALLVGAAGLIYPSVFEGFGLPLLEAMATGTPVLSSVSSSMPEVVGDCGYYFDPYSVASLHEAYASLRRDRASGAIEDLIARARVRAGGFNYDRTYEAIIQGLFADGPRLEPRRYPDLPDQCGDLLSPVRIAMEGPDDRLASFHMFSQAVEAVRQDGQQVAIRASGHQVDEGGLVLPPSSGRHLVPGFEELDRRVRASGKKNTGVEVSFDRGAVETLAHGDPEAARREDID